MPKRKCKFTDELKREFPYAAPALAVKEATFAYHPATHGQSFKSSDCSFKLVSKLLEPKFSLGKTKCEAIVVNVIVPICRLLMNFTKSLIELTLSL